MSWWPGTLPLLALTLAACLVPLAALDHHVAAPPQRHPHPQHHPQPPAYLQCAFEAEAVAVSADPAIPAPECDAGVGLPHVTALSPHTAMLPSLLADVLVIISFHWNLLKTVHLHTTLSALEKYKTNVDVIINTDRPPAVQSLLDTWQLDFRSIRPLHGHSAMPLGTYELLWGYHALLQEAVRIQNHTAFLYLEDDTLVPWSTLVSWAIDTEVLAPLGFTRGIFRTEYHRDTGALLLMDPYLPINLTIYPRKLDAFAHHPEHFCNVSQRYHSIQCPRRSIKVQRPCTVHRYYVQVMNSFQGMWILTRTQVERWMASAVWDVHQALQANFSGIDDLPGTHPLNEWGIPERSNGMPLVVDVPKGFGTNNVVPYFLGPGGRTAHLSILAHVEHTRNGYALDPRSLNSRLPLSQALCI